MISHGDEIGRTQSGNNNVYCQDNELSWVDWRLEPWQKELLVFSQRLVALRRDHPVFRRRRFFAGEAAMGGESEVGDIAWFSAGGHHMRQEDWADGFTRAVMVFLNGERLLAPDKRGQRILDDSFLLMFNAHHERQEFRLPPVDYGSWWTVELDTADDEEAAAEIGDTFGPADVVTVGARSALLLRRPLQVEDLTTATAATATPTTPGAARTTPDQPGEPGRAATVPPPTPARRPDPRM